MFEDQVSVLLVTSIIFNHFEVSVSLFRVPAVIFVFFWSNLLNLDRKLLILIYWKKFIQVSKQNDYSTLILISQKNYSPL